MGRRFTVVIGVAWLGACGRIAFDAAPGDAAGDAQGFCAGMPAATFCRDFDEGRGSSDWQSSSSLFGSMEIDSSEARSAPSSLRIDTAAFPAGDSADVALEQMSLGVATHVKAAFAVRIDAAGIGDAAIFIISMDDGSEIHDLEVVDRAPGQAGYLEDANTPSGGASTIDSFPTAELSAGVWHQVTLDYQSGAAAHLTLSYDGAPVYDGPPDFTTGGDTSAIIGIPYLAGSASPWEIHVDDVAVQVTP